MKISLVGYGKSNKSLLKRLLKDHDIFVSDLHISDHDREYLESHGVEFEVGNHSRRILESDLIVMSPGISPRTQVGKMVRESRRRYSTEVSAFFELVDSNPGKVIAVTGTNGKTTTTSMINHTLRKFRFKTFLCGNNDNPISNLREKVDFVILELSSFQLYWSSSIPVDVGVILNVHRDHEDWHGSHENYVRSKLKLSDFSKVFLRGPDVPCECGEGFHLLEDIPSHLRNSQNIENVSATVAVLEKLGFDAKSVVDALLDFEIPEHRMEFVAEINGISFYNDSKATNTHAVLKALENFEYEKVVLILSGILKEEEISEFRKKLEEVKKIIVLGERMYEALKIGVFAESMDEAVSKAFELAESGDVVLFSPAGASFDMFQDYEERGREFKRAVERLVR